MPTLGKTLSADAREFVSGASYGDSDHKSKGQASIASQLSNENSTSSASVQHQLSETRSGPAPSEETGAAPAKSPATDRRSASGSEATQGRKRSNARPRPQRGGLQGPVPLPGHAQEALPQPSGPLPPMVANFMPGMPTPFGLDSGFQPGTAPMMHGAEVPWMTHALPPHMGYGIPMNLHPGHLGLQPMPPAPPPVGMFPAVAQQQAFWGHPAGHLHPTPGMLPHRFGPHPMPYPVEEMSGMPLHPIDFSRPLQDHDMPRPFLTPDLVLAHNPWHPYPPTLDTREGTRLDKFKQCSAYRTWSYKDVRGHVVDFCKDKAGSHFIQSLLEEGAPDQVTSIINEAKDHILVLMKDAFGNYVVQKMLERASAGEKRWMLHCICGDRPLPNRVVALSKDHHSCRVIQTALQVFDMKDKLEIMSRLLEGQNALDLVAEQNGNHVIQKCIECIKPASKLEPLVQALFNGRTSMPSRSPQGQTIQLKGEIISMCQNVYGCRVVQRLLMYANAGIKAKIIEAVLRDVVANAVDTYSNYVIQHILVNGPEDARRYVWSQLGSHILELSRNKCASNVIEKCLATGDTQEVKHWVDTLVAKHDRLAELMKDQFGNYVCFTAFLKADESQRQAFVEVIHWSLHALRSSTYGKNYLIKLVVSSETSSYFSAEDLSVTTGDIDKFKKMQQTAQSNRSGNKVVPAAAQPSKAPANSQAGEPNTALTTEARQQRPAAVSELQSPVPVSRTTSAPSNGAESQQERGRVGSKTLPPNGLARYGQARRDRQASRRRDGQEVQKSNETQQADAPILADPAAQPVVTETKPSEVTRHGSFEKDLAKLPRTRSHAKSESDLERPHQVSVTADGAGPPVTRAPLGS